MAATVKTEGSFLGVDYSTLGNFEIEGLNITGTANKATATGWSGDEDQTGYFIALHFDNCTKLATAKDPTGKVPDESGDWLLLLGEESPTLEYIDVTDSKHITDRYTFDVTAAN